MATAISLDGRTLTARQNEGGEVSSDTSLHFRQEGQRISADYAGGSIVEGYLVGTFDGERWDVRYVQLTEDGETATGHSIGEVTLLDDGRVRVEDEWEWESKPGGGRTLLEEVIE
ncbi:hypothetical protein [Haloarchaeobius amylolyticus]|uniref:hypothetical protein n=1 Tax=Haloarchaeobius amylolyticus TaxID=1198296 RepID=UPI00226F1906|nr:hypothetical protein [Haloarchaeobius amylolyticus]